MTPIKETLLPEVILHDFVFSKIGFSGKDNNGNSVVKFTIFKGAGESLQKYNCEAYDVVADKLLQMQLESGITVNIRGILKKESNIPLYKKEDNGCKIRTYQNGSDIIYNAYKLKVTGIEEDAFELPYATVSSMPKESGKCIAFKVEDYYGTSYQIRAFDNIAVQAQKMHLQKEDTVSIRGIFTRKQKVLTSSDGKKVLDSDGNQITLPIFFVNAKKIDILKYASGMVNVDKVY